MAAGATPCWASVRWRLRLQLGLGEVRARGRDARFSRGRAHPRRLDRCLAIRLLELEQELARLDLVAFAYVHARDAAGDLRRDPRHQLRLDVSRRRELDRRLRGRVQRHLGEPHLRLHHGRTQVRYAEGIAA